MICVINRFFGRFAAMPLIWRDTPCFIASQAWPLRLCSETATAATGQKSGVGTHFFTASPWSIQLGWGMIFLWDYYGNSYGISLCFLCYFHVISMIFYDQPLQTWRSIKVSSSKATCYRLDGPDAQPSQLLFLLCWIVFIDPLLDFCFRFGEEIGEPCYMQQLVGFHLLCPT